jgi:hypothetical protein
MGEAWYVLEDGALGDPLDVGPDKAGVLRHKDGRAVAMAPHGPRSRSVDPDAERAKAPKPKTREAVADEPKRGYKTRELKAD